MKFYLVLFLCLLSIEGRATSGSYAAGYVESNFSGAREASDSIGQMARALKKNQDHRGLFPQIYALTIASTITKLERGEFHNPNWVKALIVNYANLYRRTIYLELTGQRSRLPVAWQEEFAYAERQGNQWMPEQDVINGINVHIARDLVEALFITPTNFNSASMRQDYFLITQALRQAMPQIWAVFLTYGHPFPLPAGFEKAVVADWISDLRVTAWENAKNASQFNTASKKMVLDLLDQQSAKSSRRHGSLLLFLPRPNPLRFRPN